MLVERRGVALRVKRFAEGAAAALLGVLLPVPALAQHKSEVVTVDVRPGVTMKYLEVRGGEAPKATVVLFAGGNGAIDLEPSGKIGKLSLNFLIRSRGLFVQQGFAVAALDVASDRRSGMNGDIRLSAQHAQDVGRVIAVLKKRIAAPVWLVGTSSGTISAAGVAARLAQSEPRPHGVVFTSTQSALVQGLCGRNVHFAQLSAIRVPVLAVSHRDDVCPCSPSSAAAGAELMAAVSRGSGEGAQDFRRRRPGALEGFVRSPDAPWLPGH